MPYNRRGNGPWNFIEITCKADTQRDQWTGRNKPAPVTGRAVGEEKENIGVVNEEKVVGYIKKSTLVIIIIKLIFLVSYADAGVIFDRYIKAEQSLIEVQRKNQDQIITLTGQQSDLASAAIGYERFALALNEIKNDKYKGSKLSDLYVLTELVRRAYSPTFIEPNSPRFAVNGKQYIFEMEYLATDKIFFSIITEMIRNDDYKPVSDSLQQTLKQFLSILSSQINKGIFSKKGAAEANRILVTFKGAPKGGQP